MRLHTRNPLWPYVGILLSLFAFSVAAPRAWKRACAPPTAEQQASTAAPVAPCLITRRSTCVLPTAAIESQSNLVDPRASAIEVDDSRESDEPFDWPVLGGATEEIETVPPHPPTLPEDAFVLTLSEPGSADEPGPLLIVAPEEDDPPPSGSFAEDASTTAVAEAPPVELPPLDIERLKQRLVNGGRHAARVASRSVAAVIQSPKTIHENWRSNFGRTERKPPDEQAGSAPPSAPSTSITRRTALPGRGGSTDSAGAPESNAGEIPENPNGSQIDGETSSRLGRLRLTDPSDRIAMRLRRRPRRNGEPPAPATPPNANSFSPNLQIAPPTSLVAGLEALADAPYTATWARATLEQIDAATAEPIAGDEALQRMESLRSSAEAGRRLALGAPTASLQVHLLRLHHAILRRVEIYEAVLAAQQPEYMNNGALAAARRLQSSVGELRQLGEPSPFGEAWCTYLMLDELSEATARGEPITQHKREELAKVVLRRIASSELTDRQQRFLESPPVSRLKRSLGHWAEGPVELSKLIRRIERYESTGSQAVGQAVALDRAALLWSDGAGEQRLANVIERHYRNANLRVALSADMVNRLLPKPADAAEPVRDHIAGADVAGQSITSTKLSVQLIPNPTALNLVLEARGKVDSSTAATSGPATFHSAGHTSYVATKRFRFTRNGLQAQPTTAGATASNVLRGIDTRFDGIPLVNSIVRSIARNEHDKSYFQAKSEVENRVAEKARTRLETEIKSRIEAAEIRLREKLLDPIEALALNPKAMDLRTTNDRMIVRMRLAGEDQASAETPRPRAPADSTISIQLHESALNNTAAQLGLDGKTFTLPELHKTVWTKLGRPETVVPEDMPRTARVSFARYDAVRFRFQDGRLKISLSIAKVKHRRNSYHNFKVHAYYRPVVDGLHTQLVRDGVITIEGKRMRTGSHVALQGIFVKLFSKKRPMTLLPAERNNDPRLAGLMVTQLVLEDGWIGLAIGPRHSKRVAQLAR